MKPEEVREVAKLARLELSEDEISTYADQLTKVLDYVALLDEVDTEGVEPMVHALDQGNVFRTDEVRPSLSREDALLNAPKTDGKYFQVPQVIDQS
ncbi:MAG: Asp-tRNA(Asn)/Glu-tRNA(Gln) amidotransferase subunit GatC [Fuerstiella sp.]